MAGTSTTGRTSARSTASKSATSKRTTTKRATSKRASTEHGSTKRQPSRDSAPDAPLFGGFGGVLRDSVNSVMGTAGLNVPLRAIERLTGAVERAAVLLERTERATRHLDRVDAGFIDRLNDSFQVLADMRKDTKAMRSRVDELETEMRDLQTLLTERLDRVPLMRPSRRARKAAQAGAGEGQ